jgi:hypothetical protein
MLSSHLIKLNLHVFPLFKNVYLYLSEENKSSLSGIDITLLKREVADHVRKAVWSFVELDSRAKTTALLTIKFSSSISHSVLSEWNTTQP